MRIPENPTEQSIDAGFPMSVIYSDYLSDALDTGQTDNIHIALREIRKAMQNAPNTKVCDFDLNLTDVFQVLKESSLSPPRGN